MNQVIIDTQKAEEIQDSVYTIDTYKQGVSALSKSLSDFREVINQAIIPALTPMMQQREYLIDVFKDSYSQYKDIFINIGREMLELSGGANNLSHLILNYYYDAISEEQQEEINKANEKIITEIFQPDTEKKINIEESPIIVLSPVNEQVLKYISENPKILYQLSGREFENVMAEIYLKLGYDVTVTKATRDGGKDIIIRKPDALGDFIYYVECKKYSPNHTVGIGIVQRFVGTVNTERVNGGILATTSFFTEPAKQFVLDNKLNYQIKMHDYYEIQKLLNQSIKK